MKKAHALCLTVLVFSLCILAPSLSSAQKATSFGFMIGPEYSSRYYPHVSNQLLKPRLGLVAQGHAQINLSSHLSLDIGLGYSLKRYVEIYQNNRTGFSPKGNELPRYEIDYTHHGIDLPVLLKYYFSGANSGLYAGLGVNPGLQIRTVVNTDKI